ncbi:hypothetical protein ACN4EK_11805 [Pantanalinema rosaneae CENA516]|uniref:hypothetical protein n=1 Tax=Pantanalinema rosaneae TaxID=1620701 RepID=UPI003D6DA91B
MKPPTKRLGFKPLRYLPLVFLAGWLNYQGWSAFAQQATIIPNTASASYRAEPGAPRITATSNTVTVPIVSERLEIVKTADRGAAEPGDTIVYRLQIRNTGGSPVSNLVVDDNLPLGFSYTSGSLRGSVASADSGSTTVDLPAPRVDGREIAFSYAGPLAPQQTLTIAYAVLVSPEAIRGNGRNRAVAIAVNPAGGEVSSPEATYLVRVRPGILSDCGTVLGRVFVDKNFDGEQQPGEPGVPNAVIFMDDGNRITTDADGLFSLPYAVSGLRTGTLDLTSLPGYTLAPNLYRIEGNSASRLVRLAPGGMVRMNFAVTPTFGVEGKR